MLAEKNSCNGCGACAASCPLGCIVMQEDREGFRYPAVDAERCVSCHKCENVCPLLNELPAQDVPLVYGGKHKNAGIRESSSSGGVFPAVAAFVLENGGVVCAAAYRENFEVVHQIIENVSDLGKLQGAKYSQSRVSHLFAQMRSILESGRWLLFVGTPCQVAGFHGYLGKAYDKLILVDMICHGVPSPMVWQEYLAYRRQKDARNAEIVQINQRDKVSGWSRYRYSLRIGYGNGKSYCAPQSEDMYMRGFVNNLYLRPSCAQCQFKASVRCADLTLGDYWGVWEQHPEFDDDKGISLVLIHTQKGADCWDRIKSNLDCISVDAKEALDKNPSARSSSAPHPKRDVFFENRGNVDFEKLVAECLYGVVGKRDSLRNILHRIINR